jgi:hypothetical protein
MESMWDRIKNEPALVTGLVEAVIALVTGFGLHLSAGQIAGIMALTAALLALFVRTQVTPVRTLKPTRPTNER